MQYPRKKLMRLRWNGWNFQMTFCKQFIFMSHRYPMYICLDFIKICSWMFDRQKSALIQVMTWCHQATTHYLSQCWCRCMAPYGVTRPLLIGAEWCIYTSVNEVIIGSDNGLSPGRHQAIIWTSAGILLIGPVGTNFNEILIEIDIFSVKKMHFKMSSAKMAAILSRPQCVKPELTIL